MMEQSNLGGSWASPQIGERAASVIMLDSGKVVPLLVVLAILCGTAMGLTAFGFWAARESSVETRMLEYYVMQVDGKLMQANIIKPDESWSAQKAKQLKPEQEKKP
jgi:hypothetical protein